MDEVEYIVQKYGDMLFRICLVELHSIQDAEDAVQDTYLKYIAKKPRFECEEHRRNWLIRVAVNRCRDIHRSNRIRTFEDIDALGEILADEGEFYTEEQSVIKTLMLLPEKFSTVMLLHFAEGYDYKTIAKLIGKSESAVKMRIKKGRELFAKLYEKEENRL